MEKFLLIEDESILDSCFSSSLKKADDIFNSRGWVVGEVISEADFLIERKEEVSLELLSFNN